MPVFYIEEGEWSGSYSVEPIDGQSCIIPGKIADKVSSFRRSRAMIPFEYIDKTGKDFDWNIYGVDVGSEKDIVNNFITHYEEFRKDGTGLYIYSNTKGSGKTMLACCILNELSHRYRISTKFVTILDFIEITKKGFDGNKEEENSLYKCSVLVIDDIGVQMAKEWVDTVLYRIINHRYNNHLVTIFTSNLKVEDLKINDRIIDRIDSNSFSISIPEVSIRRIKSDQKKQQLVNKIKNATELGATSNGKN